MSRRKEWKNNADFGESDVRDEILRQLYERSSDSSICPSDVARSMFQLWREKMDLVREVAAEMARDGAIEVTQSGEVVDLETAKGPIRLRRPRL